MPSFHISAAFRRVESGEGTAETGAALRKCRGGASDARLLWETAALRTAPRVRLLKSHSVEVQSGKGFF